MTSVRKALGIVALAVAAAALAAPASASVFYGVSTDGRLTQFDMAAQTVTTLGSVTVGPTSITGLADLEFDGSGNLYALQAIAMPGFPPPPHVNNLLLVNPDTHTALSQGSFGTALSNIHLSLGYRPSDGTLNTVKTSTGQVGTLNPVGAIFSPVSATGNGLRNTVEALAVDPTNGLAYGIVNMGDGVFFPTDYSLISLNLDTGIASLIGSLGQGASPFKALRFDDLGTAYTVNHANGNVYTVDLATGAASFAFAGGSAAVGTTGLAFIPAPGAAIAFVLAGAGLLRRRR